MKNTELREYTKHFE